MGASATSPPTAVQSHFLQHPSASSSAAAAWDPAQATASLASTMAAPSAASSYANHAAVLASMGLSSQPPISQQHQQLQQQHQQHQQHQQENALAARSALMQAAGGNVSSNMAQQNRQMHELQEATARMQSHQQGMEVRCPRIAGAGCLFLFYILTTLTFTVFLFHSTLLHDLPIPTLQRFKNIFLLRFVFCAVRSTPKCSGCGHRWSKWS
jgi:hypothetical protein